MMAFKINGQLIAISIMLSIAFSCASSNQNNQANKEIISEYIELSDSSKLILLPRGIGTLRIDLPNEFNKRFEMTSIADCGCCCRSTSIGYIDTSKHNWEIPDTIINYLKIDHEIEMYRFSIKVKACSKCDSSLIITSEELQNHVNYKRARNNNISLIKNEIVQINGLKLMVIGTSSHINDRFSERLYITTMHKNERIDITFDRLAIDSTNFVKRMYKTLSTIEFRD